MAAGKKKVLIIGDSISIGYTPYVAELLASVAEVVHNPGNGGDTENIRAHLDEWLAQAPAQLVHFNAGLHDIKVTRGGTANQVPLERYRRNLSWIVERLQATGAVLIWASTTPVIESWHQARKEFDRYNRDVEAYNAAAEEIVSAAGIPIDDLHAAVASAGPEKLMTPDGAHYTDPAYRMLGQVVAECIARHL